MKKLISFAVAGMLALSLAACGSSSSAAASSTESSAESTAASTADSAAADSDLAYLQNKGKMTIGYTVYEPMNYTDESGTFTGFDTELATAVCEKLGVEPEFVEINWDTKETELAAKSIDCIRNGLPVRPWWRSPDLLVKLPLKRTRACSRQTLLPRACRPTA